jgi:hypothetical protein
MKDPQAVEKTLSSGTNYEVIGGSGDDGERLAAAVVVVAVDDDGRKDVRRSYKSRTGQR